jgi:uncharacterized membrane protein YgaE (UPF0421/DUF939 family)
MWGRISDPSRPGQARQALVLCGRERLVREDSAGLPAHDTIARCMAAWATRLGLTREALLHSARTAIAAVVSMLLARALKLAEFYWAPISTIVILLSATDPLTLAWQRFAGTALGAVVGALIATYVNVDWLVYGVGILVCGILSALLRLGVAYRFAAITLTIVVLIAHVRPPWIVAYHRFVEVSLGIAVALLVTTVWRLPPAK